MPTSSRVMLNAPEMVYLVEHGETEVTEQPGSYALSAYELASRLSYQLWQTLPDEALLAAADDGSLLDPDVYAGQVDRMLGDLRARVTLDEFFADWIKVQDRPSSTPTRTIRCFARSLETTYRAPGCVRP